MRVDYLLHEEKYREFRSQEGRRGWARPEAEEGSLAELDAMASWPDFPRQGRLLEVGCGAGIPAIHMAGLGFDVVGVDISPTAVEWAQENAASAGVFARARFSVGDVLVLDGFDDESFDVVVDGHCLHCIIGDDRRRFYAACLRVLRPGGALAIRTMVNMLQPDLHGYQPESKLCMYGEFATRYIGHQHDILREVIDAGFEIRHAEVRPDPDEVNEMLLALVVRPSE